MKIIKNNFNDINKIDNFTPSYPRKLICETCGSELEYEESDMRMGLYGCMHVDCPLCGNENMIEDNEHNITLTKNNIEFPTHFSHSSKENGAVDVCNNKYVKNLVNEAIEYFKRNKDESYWFSGSGNTMVFVFKFDDDEDYDIFVCPNYYETYIPFQSEDYGGNNGQYKAYKLCERE